MDSNEIQQVLDDPAIKEKQEIPPESGYWLFIKEISSQFDGIPPEFELYAFITYGNPKEPVQLLGHSRLYSYVQQLLQEQANRHLEYLVKKDAGTPTPNQLAFLFKQKIPIPIDLTYGQASTLIDEEVTRLKQERQHRAEEKQRKKAEAEEQAFLQRQSYIQRFPVGSCLSHPIFGKGDVTKNDGEMLSIDFEAAGIKTLSLAVIAERLSPIS